MIEKNRTDFPDINHTDRVFDYEGTLVKVRMIRQDVHRDGLITSPQAITLHITGAACDGQGKAIARADGNFYICSKAHTISLEGVSDLDLSETVLTMIEQCCKLTVEQKLQIEKMDALAKTAEKHIELDKLL